MDKQEFLWDDFLDDQGEIDPENKFITWTNNLEIAEVIADHSEKSGEGFEEDNDKAVNWKPLVPKYLWKYGDVFSKKKKKSAC